MIHHFYDFTNALREAGFSSGGSSSEEIYSLSAQYGENITYHTGDPDTDPWEWRMRVLEECPGIAYAKFFFRKSGYITKQWYPYFLAARRGGATMEDAYMDGMISRQARLIYEAVRENESLPLHHIKQIVGVSKEENAKFEKALVDLQMKMVITMCGRQRKTSKVGGEYGWSSTVFYTTEHFFGEDVFAAAEGITEKEAAEAITAQVYKLNPNAESKKVLRFVYG